MREGEGNTVVGEGRGRGGEMEREERDQLISHSIRSTFMECLIQLIFDIAAMGEVAYIYSQ